MLRCACRFRHRPGLIQVLRWPRHFWRGFRWLLLFTADPPYAVHADLQDDMQGAGTFACTRVDKQRGIVTAKEVYPGSGEQDSPCSIPGLRRGRRTTDRA